MNIFISGTAGFGSAKKITKLPSIVITKLNIMIEKGYNILIGDCQGIDTLVQYCLECEACYRTNRADRKSVLWLQR